MEKGVRSQWSLWKATFWKIDGEEETALGAVSSFAHKKGAPRRGAPKARYGENGMNTGTFGRRRDLTYHRFVIP